MKKIKKIFVVIQLVLQLLFSGLVPIVHASEYEQVTDDSVNDVKKEEYFLEELENIDTNEKGDINSDGPNEEIVKDNQNEVSEIVGNDTVETTDNNKIFDEQEDESSSRFNSREVGMLNAPMTSIDFLSNLPNDLSHVMSITFHRDWQTGNLRIHANNNNGGPILFRGADFGIESLLGGQTMNLTDTAPTHRFNIRTRDNIPDSVIPQINAAMSTAPWPEGTVLRLAFTNPDTTWARIGGTTTRIPVSNDGEIYLAFDSHQTNVNLGQASLLSLNNADVIGGTILKGTSESELQTRVNEFLKVDHLDGDIEEVYFVEFPNQFSVGRTQGTIRVVERIQLNNGSTRRYHYDYVVPIEVEEAHHTLAVTPSAITAGTISQSNPEIGISLLPGDDLKIVANHAAEANTTANIQSRPRLEVFRNTENNSILSLPTHTVFQSRATLVDDWNNRINQNRLGNNSIQYGDVLKGQVFHRDTGSLNRTGETLFAYRNGERIAEAFGYNVAYYMLTPEGYSFMRINQLETQKIDVPFGTSKEEMDDLAREFFTFHDNFTDTEKDQFSFNFKEYDSTNTAGNNKSGTVVVTQTHSSGSSFSLEYDVRFDVTNHIIETKDIEVPLGTNPDTFDLKKFIQAVRVDGTNVEINDYEITLKDDLEFNIVGTKETTIQVKVNGRVYNEVVSYDVQWRHTLAVTPSVISAGTISQSNPEIGISLLPGDDLKIVANHAAEANTTANIQSRPRLEVFRNTENNSILSLPTHTVFQSRATLVDDWNNRINQNRLGNNSIQYGDVLKGQVFHRDTGSLNRTGETLFAYRNGERIAEAFGYNVAYYMLTPEGYSFMRINQLETQKIDVPFGTSKEEMDDLAREFFTFHDNFTDTEKDQFSFNFKEYDSTNTAGNNKSGTVVVTQTHSSGSSFSLEYDVRFDVTNHIIETKDIEVPLGTNPDTFDLKKFIQAVRVDGTNVEINDYEITLKDDLEFNIVGTKETTIQVKVNGRVYNEVVSYDVQWRHTLAVTPSVISAGTISQSNPEIGISLLPGDDLKIVANHAAEANTTANIQSRPRLEVFRNTENNSILSLPTHTVFQSRATLVDDWNNRINQNRLGNNSIQYGDVLKGQVFHRDTGSLNRTGETLFAYRNGERIAEAFGYNVAYYMLTPEGYSFMRINQLETQKIDVPFGTSKEEMDDLAREFFTFHDNFTDTEKDQFSFNFKEYDSTNTAGNNKSGTVVVTQTHSSGSSFSLEYDVRFDVTNHIIETKDIEVPLGTNPDTFDLKKFIQAVRVDGTNVEINDYEITLKDDLEFNIVGTKETTIQVKVNGRVYNEVVSYDVQWRHTLAVTPSVISAGTISQSNPEIGISLLPGDDLKIVANHAAEANTTANIQSRPRLEVFRNTENNSILSLPTHTVFQSRATLVDDWNNRINQNRLGNNSIQYGDVLKGQVFHRDTGSLNRTGETLFAYRNGERIAEAFGYNVAYYMLTPEGYSFMRINQLETQKIDVPFGTSKEEMDDLAREFFTFHDNFTDTEKDQFSFNFKEYDSTNTAGNNKSGTVVVTQTHSSGSSFSLEYDVRFDVTNHIIETKDIEVPLGTNPDTFDLKKFIQAVRVDGTNVEINDYEITLKDDLEFNIVGTKETTIQVKVNGRVYNEVVSYDVQWRHTLAVTPSVISAGTISQSNPEIGISLLPGDDLKIVANHAAEANTTANIQSRPRLEVFRNTENNSILSLPTHTVFQSRATLVDDWNNRINQNRLGNNSIQYGDVLKGQVFHRDTGSLNRTGETLFAYRNGERIAEAFGYNVAYYMLTPEGYSFMRINQLETQKIDVPFGTSKEEMDDLAREFFTFHDNFTDTEKDQFSFNFKEYDSTNTAGNNKSGTVVVTQTHSSGSSFSLEYDVRFDVTKSNIHFDTIPEVFDFGQNNSIDNNHQLINAINLSNNNKVSVYDNNVDSSDWSVSAKASMLKKRNNKKIDSYLTDSQYIFTLETGEKKQLPTDNQTSVEIFSKIEQSSSFYSEVIFNEVQLLLYEKNSLAGHDFVGEILWSLDLVP